MDTANHTTSILGVAVRDLNRLRQVTTTVVRHGFGELVLRSPLSKLLFKDRQLPEPDEELRKAPPAQRFKRLLESLGPTYIKLGQVLSTRPDLLPRDYIEELKHLQDNAPELPFEIVKQVIEDSLGAHLRPCSRSLTPRSSAPPPSRRRTWRARTRASASSSRSSAPASRRSCAATSTCSTWGPRSSKPPSRRWTSTAPPTS